jgi:hypothetical protein
MALSNAERQRRYITRLKSQAAHAAVLAVRVVELEAERDAICGPPWRAARSLLQVP